MTEGNPKGESRTSNRFTAIAVDARAPERARLLSELVGAFAATALDPAPLICAIAERLADTVGDLCTVLTLTADGSALEIAAAHDPSDDVLAVVRDSFSDTRVAVMPAHQKVLETGEPLLLGRSTADRLRGLLSDPCVELAKRVGMHSVMLVAMRRAGAPIGVISMLRHRAELPPYDEHDRELVQLVADNAAIAIANARALKERERELVASRDFAERASRELETFSYTVAHDLRGPLRAIDRFAGALQSESAALLDEDGHHYLGRVRSATERMDHLIEDLLTLSRATHVPLHRERVDLGEMVRRIVADLDARMPERQIDVRIGDYMVVNADPRLTRVVLENLLDNAWKYTSRRSTAVVEVGVVNNDGEPVWYVHDNGAGFDMRQAANLFEPFQRLHADDQFEGTGVGLATVRRVIVRHGGRVWAESEPDRGTTFYFTLSAPPGVPSTPSGTFRTLDE